MAWGVAHCGGVNLAELGLRLTEGDVAGSVAFAGVGVRSNDVAEDVAVEVEPVELLQ